MRLTAAISNQEDFIATGSATLDKRGKRGKRGTEQPADALDYDPDLLRKRPQRSFRLSSVEDTSDRPAATANHGGIYEPINPIEFWARESQWPQEYLEFDMENLLARKRSLSSFSRKRSNFATSTTLSD
ncbi:hypothetical protein F5Y07DRAFT_323002 [Xylaria sp. FL0933]|nr:hypothetical protein F5Y07DRAFT_323002 [Xylaria sp. FL0933]